MFVTQGLDDAGRATALSDAGRARAARPRILPLGRPEDGRDPRPSIAPMSRRSCRLAGMPTRQARAGPDHRARDEDRAGARDARGRARTSPRRDKSVDAAPTSRRRRRASTGARCSTPRSSATVQKFDAYHAGAIPKLAALVGSRAARRVEGLAGLPHAQPAGERAAQGVRRRAASPSTARRSAARRSSGRATSCALNATSGALQDAVGKVYVDKYFPASAKAEIQDMVTNIKAAFAKRVQAIDWMAPSTKEEALQEGRDDRRRRRLSRQLARLFGARRSAPTMPTATRSARGCANISTRSPRSASRSTAANGG